MSAKPNYPASSANRRHRHMGALVSRVRLSSNYLPTRKLRGVHTAIRTTLTSIWGRRASFKHVT